MSGKKILVVGAHSADFVWRAGGTIALTTTQGGNCFESGYLSLSVDIKEMRDGIYQTLHNIPDKGHKT